MTLPRGCYEYVCDITATIYGKVDRTITLLCDFECVVEVDCDLSGGEVEMTCLDVLVEGKSLRNGDDAAKAIRLKVMEAADAEMAAGGWLFEKVRDAEGLSLSGHPNDPDTHWRQAAE